MGFEPMNNGFAGRCVSHFAIRAHVYFSLLLYYRKRKKPAAVWQWVSTKPKKLVD